VRVWRAADICNIWSFVGTLPWRPPDNEKPKTAGARLKSGRDGLGLSWIGVSAGSVVGAAVPYANVGVVLPGRDAGPDSVPSPRLVDRDIYVVASEVSGSEERVVKIGRCGVDATCTPNPAAA